MIKASPYEKKTILFYDYEAYSALVCPFLYSASLVNLRKSLWNFGSVVIFALCICTCPFCIVKKTTNVFCELSFSFHFSWQFDLVH